MPAMLQDRADPLGSPPSSVSRRVRKRVSTDPYLPYGQSLPQGHPSDQYHHKSQRAPTIAMRLRNFMTFLFMASFPMGIFWLPMWLSKPSYPRVVVSLTTTPARLPFLEATLESLLLDQSLMPDTVYLVLPDKNYYTKETLEYDNDDESWPDFLDSLVQNTPLQVLKVTWDYGPVSKILYALEKETEEDTRIIYVNDDVLYSRTLVQGLVDASLQTPNAVVAKSGGKLRSKFRQIKDSDLKYDKPPNLFMQVSGTPSFPGHMLSVDIVQGFAGVCLPAKLLNTEAIYQVLQDPSVPTAVVESDDVLVSAVMQAQNITKWIVPGRRGYIKFTNSSKVSSLTDGMHQHLIQSTHYLQQRLDIWKQFDLLDWSKLTQAQVEAIDCEAAHEQDCDSSDEEGVCLPNTKDCPEAVAVLQDLSSQGP
jgi:hypothetical protein